MASRNSGCPVRSIHEGMDLGVLLVLVALALPILQGIRIVPETQRFVVLRLGRSAQIPASI